MASTLENSRVATILEPYDPSVSATVIDQLSVYLDLLVKWNGRTNLTAIRDPEEMVRRHFGESLFVARHLPPCETLLDLGSGAGFPGLPIQIALPQLRVTLAESQHKKAAFLQEVIRTLALPTEVWANRVETMPPSRVFDIVTLRAVDNPRAAELESRRRLSPGGLIASLSSGTMTPARSYPLPGTQKTWLHLYS